SGIPGAGKSHFGQWLEDNHGYVHVDVEKDGRLDTYHLIDDWNSCFTSPDVGPFVKSLHCLGERVVVNWGFPPRFLSVVQGSALSEKTSHHATSVTRRRRRLRNCGARG